MPKPKLRRTHLFATDHRALVLESVATSPLGTLAGIISDCTAVDASFTPKKIGAMVWWLRRIGLIQLNDFGRYTLTKLGLEWLTDGRFDRALPKDHTRPGARKPRRK